MPDETRDITYRIRVDTSDLETSMASIDQRVTAGVGVGLGAGVTEFGPQATISDRIFGAGYRYAESIHSGEARESAGRLGENLANMEGVLNSAYLRERGYRPLDIFVGEQRRMMLMESMSVPISSRLLSMQERGAVTAAGAPYLPGATEYLEEIFPGLGGFAYPVANLATGGFLDYMLGVNNMARQQQASSAAGIIAQTGGEVSRQSIESMMNSMSAIQASIPGARAEDVALAAGIVQRQGAIPNAYEGMRRIQEVMSGIQNLSIQFGITDMDQRRALVDSLVAANVPSESFNRIGLAAKSVSAISGRSMYESLNSVISSRTRAEYRGLPAVAGEVAAKNVEAAYKAMYKTYGYSLEDINVYGGPAAMRGGASDVLMSMATHPQAQNALVEMAEKTGSFEFNEEAFMTALRTPGKASSEYINSLSAHDRHQIQMSAASNSLTIASARVELAREHGRTDPQIERSLAAAYNTSLMEARLALDSMNQQKEVAESERVFGRELVERAASRNVLFSIDRVDPSSKSGILGFLPSTTRVRGMTTTTLALEESERGAIRMYGDPKLGVTQAEASVLREALTSTGMSDSDISGLISYDESGATLDLQAFEEHISSAGSVSDEYKRSLEGVVSGTKGMLSARLMKESGIESGEDFRGISRYVRSSLLQNKTLEEISESNLMREYFGGDDRASERALEFLKKQAFTFAISGEGDQLVVTEAERIEEMKTGKIKTRTRPITTRSLFSKPKKAEAIDKSTKTDQAIDDTISALSTLKESLASI